MKTRLLLTPRAVLFSFQHAGSLFTYLELFPLPPEVRTFDPSLHPAEGLVLPEDTLSGHRLAGRWAGAEGRKAQVSSEALVTGVRLANE